MQTVEEGNTAVQNSAKRTLLTENYVRNTPLHLAVLHRKLESITILLESGADVNAKNNSGLTPLHLTVKDDGCFAEILIRYGSDLNAKDHWGFTPLHWAVSERKSKYQLDNNFQLVRISANTESSLEVIKLLLEAGADYEGNTPLHKAIDCHSLEKVSLLLDNNADINSRGKNGCTPLHMAVNQYEVAFLVDRGGKIDIRDDEGNTPLHIAVVNQNLNVIQALLAADGDVNVQDQIGRTALYLIVNEVSGDIIMEFLHPLIERGADLDIPDEKGYTPLHIAVCRNNFNLAAMLLYYNADACVTNYRGLTPLMLAFETQAVEHQILLLEYETDFNRANSDGASTLCLAALRNSGLVHELLDRGGNIFSSFLDFYEEILPNVDVFNEVWNRLDYQNISWGIFNSALGYAVFYENSDIFQYVVECDQLQQILEHTYILQSQDLLSLKFNHEFNRMYYMGIEGLMSYAINNFTKARAKEIIFILLSHGYSPDFIDVQRVFRSFKHFELFSFLLHIDLEPRELSREILIKSIIFDVSKTVKEHIEAFINETAHSLSLEQLKHNVEITVPFSTIYELTNYYKAKDRTEDLLCITDNRLLKMLTRRMPSLQELSRDQLRQTICSRYQITTYRRFHEYINSMNIGSFKHILNFEVPIY